MYGRIICEYQVTVFPALPGQAGPDLTLNELQIRFWTRANRFYVDGEGNPTKEFPCLRDAVRVL